MKIRIKGDTLRLRLSQTEVRQLADNYRLSESISFGADQRLIYSLSRSNESDSLQASFRSGEIAVVLPDDLALAWANSEEVSLEGRQPIIADRQLHILVEKDFQCLADRPGEDEEDLFPHPRSGQDTC